VVSSPAEMVAVPMVVLLLVETWLDDGVEYWEAAMMIWRVVRLLNWAEPEALTLATCSPCSL